MSESCCRFGIDKQPLIFSGLRGAQRVLRPRRLMHPPSARSRSQPQISGWRGCRLRSWSLLSSERARENCSMPLLAARTVHLRWLLLRNLRPPCFIINLQSASTVQAFSLRRDLPLDSLSVWLSIIGVPGLLAVLLFQCPARKKRRRPLEPVAGALGS